MSSNLLEIYCDATSGVLKTFDLIPKQTLKLVAYRISFDTVANAKTAKMLKFNAEFLGNNSFSKAVDDNGGSYNTNNFSGIPLPVDNNNTARVIPVNIDISMANEIDGDQTYYISSVGGTTGFENLTLIFSYSTGMI